MKTFRILNFGEPYETQPSGPSLAARVLTLVLVWLLFVVTTIALSPIDPNDLNK
jgi:hypothetical protein